MLVIDIEENQFFDNGNFYLLIDNKKNKKKS